jgi:hypothetical protein
MPADNILDKLNNYSYFPMYLSPVINGVICHFVTFPRLFGNISYPIGAKAYKKDLILEYSNRIDRGTAYVLNISFLAFQDKRKVTEIPVRCEDYRQSRFNIIDEGFYRSYNLFKLWYVEKHPHNLYLSG